jgi:subtilisin-like proprotein convertase family protein
VDVTVNLTHTWDEDLELVLVSPAGTRVDLSSDNGGSGNNYTGTIFDDEAPNPVVGAFPPFTGRFRPEGLLSNFDHQDPNGTWTLEIRDDAGEDVGVLLSWSITLTTQGKGEASAVTGAEGRYLFENLSPGQYFVREVDQPDWLQTAPAGGKHDVTLSAGEEELDLDFGNQSQLVTLAGRVYDDLNGDGDGEGDPSLAGWVVYRDLNLNGTRDANPSVTQDFPSTDVPLAINDLATQTSVISVSGLIEPVADVNVSLSGTHTFDDDLDVFLISPSGTRVELFTDIGDDGLNFSPTLDDEAAGLIADAAAPFDGTFRPEGLLSAFDGELPGGVWTLEITDDEADDIGNLAEWSLTITTIGTGEPFRVTGADGRYEFDFLPPGEHTLREEVQPPFTPTEPVGGIYTLTLTPAQQSLDLDFGNSQCLHDRDLDNDLDVDRDDLLLLFAKFGQSATPDEGDIDCNGSITLADVAELQSNLTPPPPSAGAAPSAPAAAVARIRAVIDPAAADRAHAELSGGVTRRLATTRRTSDAPQRQTPESQLSTPAPATEQPTATATDETPSDSLRARRQRRDPQPTTRDPFV